MECQLRPLVYSLDINNSPRIGLTPGKSRVKNIWRNKQGGSWCKMAGAGIQSFGKFRAQMCTAECKGLRRSCGLWRFAENLRAEPFLWHSAVKFYQGVGIPQYIGEWWLAFRSPLESDLPRSYSCCGNLRHLTAELGKWPNSSTRHFTSTVPLFVTVRHKLLRRDFLGVRKTRSRLFRPKLYTNGLSWQTISWYYPFKEEKTVSTSSSEFKFKYWIFQHRYKSEYWHPISRFRH
jgi:hypothetical protein